MTTPDRPVKTDGDVISVFGAAGAGKSMLLARSLVRDWRNDRQIVALDVTASLGNYAQNIYHLPPDAISFATSAKEAFARIGRSRFIVMHPGRESTIRAIADDWLTVASTMERGTVYAVDESELTFPNHEKPIDDDRQLRLAMLARNNGIRLYLAGKRPQKVHIDFREVSTDVVVMHLDSERAVTYGCQPWGEPRAFLPCLQLPRFAALYRGRFSNGSITRVTDSRQWELPWPA